MKAKTWVTATLISAFVIGSLSAMAMESDPKARLQTAEKMFAERCKKSGEFIQRTAESVEGVFLMKLRSSKTNYRDQFVMNDPYGADIAGEGHIINFLRARNAKGSLVDDGGVTNGYRYIEAIDPADGQRYRYTGSIKEVTKTSSPLVGGDGKSRNLPWVAFSPPTPPPATASPTKTSLPVKSATTGSPAAR